MCPTEVIMSKEQGPAWKESTAPDKRRFLISDAMTLIMATALGLAATHFMSGLPPYLTNRSLYAEVMVCWVAIFLGLALPLLCLRAPLLPWRQLIRQPGFVASVALDVSLLFRVGLYSDMLVWPINSRSGGWWGFLGLLVYPNQNACSVVAAWTTLAVCGLWKAGANWPDRLGRALGVFWLCAALLVRVSVHLSLL